MNPERAAGVVIGAIRELVSAFDAVAQEHRAELEQILARAMGEATRLALAATVAKIAEHETNLSHLLTQAKMVAAKIEFEIAVEAREKFTTVLGTVLTHALRSAAGGQPMSKMLQGAGLL